MANLSNPPVNIQTLKTVEKLNGRVKEYFTDNEIIQLAEEYSIPHYRLSNPITKSETILFNSSEINQWIETNCLKRHDPKFNAIIHTTHFDPDIHAISKDDVVPPGLSLINDLFKLPSYDILTPPGIYFLCLGSQIVYIGQAMNVSARVRQHIFEAQKKFNQVFFITCHKSNLFHLEGLFIKKFRPKYNKAMNSPRRGLLNLSQTAQ